MRLRLATASLLLLLAACVASGGTGSSRSPNVLTAEEIAASPVANALQAVEQLRPQWLAARSVPTPTGGMGLAPMIYIDGIQMDGVEDLARIQASAVQRMEYMRPSDATNRYGTNHTSGAILVITR